MFQVDVEKDALLQGALDIFERRKTEGEFSTKMSPEQAQSYRNTKPYYVVDIIKSIKSGEYIVKVNFLAQQ